jgi:EAL domain-containing protein (putative c-di-GMP-specific phosphodiesterase class I)
LIHPNGGKYWQLAYRFAGKQKTLALGTYPEVTLADARERREHSRKLIANDIDPSAVKQTQKRQAKVSAANTFEAVAREWVENRSNDWTEGHKALTLLETACAQLKAWQQEALTRDLVLAINVSAKQFRQAVFVGQVQSAVQRHAINPRLLKLELTESLLQENIDETIAIMTLLNVIGIQFSLDDFGTGYSSLQYLKRLPLNQIKIDQSFVSDIFTDSSDRAVGLATIAMARSLELDVIAEGVETEEQRQLLLTNGCSNFQGYLFGRPVPIEQFGASLKQS